MDKSDPFLSFLGINELPSVANPEDEATPTEQPEDSKGKGKGKKGEAVRLVKHLLNQVAVPRKQWSVQTSD